MEGQTVHNSRQYSGPLYMLIRSALSDTISCPSETFLDIIYGMQNGRCLAWQCVCACMNNQQTTKIGLDSCTYPPTHECTHAAHVHGCTLRNKVFKTHQIWCAFTVPPGTHGIPREVCLSHHIMMSSTHSFSGISTSALVCTSFGVLSTVPPSTPNMVVIAHFEYCVQNGRCWSDNRNIANKNFANYPEMSKI